MRPGDISENVLYGHGDWLFLWQGAQFQFDMLSGVRSPALGSTENFVRNLANRNAICGERHLPYLHVVFPSKPVVMTEFVPDPHGRSIKSLYEAHYAEAVNEQGPIPVLYPRDLLLEAKQQHQVFRKTDTHMTDHGSAIVSRAILSQLGEVHDPLQHFTAKEAMLLGDLSAMVGDTKKLLETVLVPKHTSVKVFDNLPFLKGNTNNIKIYYNSRAASAKRLLVLGDSFMALCLPFLSTFFRDIFFVRSDVWQPDLLESFLPDAVISSNTERYLATVRPDAAGASILMNLHGRPGYNPTPAYASALRAQTSRRYYPQVYCGWQAEMDSLSFPGLGPAYLNAHLAIKDGQVNTFASSGTDPCIVFPNTFMKNDTAYELHVDMDSDTKATAQVFFGRPTGEAYVAEASVTEPVVEGSNTLVFSIPAVDRSRSLRFDPLDCLGSVKIKRMELRAII